MNREDYVSFETAKLLKDKGFNEPVLRFYDHKGEVAELHLRPQNKSLTSDKYKCPTLQMAMKWLREVHNLCIEPYRTACGYLSTISKIPTGSELYSQEYEGDDEDSGQFTSYEKSCEAAIEYCLNFLI